jgi:hypothetical protein
MFRGYGIKRPAQILRNGVTGNWKSLRPPFHETNLLELSESYGSGTGFRYEVRFAVKAVGCHPFATSHKAQIAAVQPNSSTHSLTGLSAVQRFTSLVSSAGSSDPARPILRIIVGAK